MWILFGHNPQIIFVTFYKLNVAIFTAKVNRFKVFYVGNSSYSFVLILLKLFGCLGHGLKMCIVFGHNPQIIFVAYTLVSKRQSYYGMVVSVLPYTRL